MIILDIAVVVYVLCFSVALVWYVLSTYVTKILRPVSDRLNALLEKVGL